MTRTCRAAVAMVTSCALVLSACSNSTDVAVQQAPQAPKLSSMHLARGFPADTPGLRNLVVDFTVRGAAADEEIVLSEDGTGFLIVKSDRMEDPVKLDFRNAEKVTYSLPFDELKVLAVGSSLICQDNAFGWQLHDGADLEIGIEVVASGYTQNGENVHRGSLKLTGLPAGRILHISCRSAAAWEADLADRESGGDLDLVEVALIAGAVTVGAGLLAACLGTVGIGCLVGGGAIGAALSDQ